MPAGGDVGDPPHGHLQRRSRSRARAPWRLDSPPHDHRLPRGLRRRSPCRGRRGPHHSDCASAIYYQRYSCQEGTITIDDTERRAPSCSWGLFFLFFLLTGGTRDPSHEYCARRAGTAIPLRRRTCRCFSEQPPTPEEGTGRGLASLRKPAVPTCQPRRAFYVSPSVPRGQEA